MSADQIGVRLRTKVFIGFIYLKNEEAKLKEQGGLEIGWLIKNNTSPKIWRGTIF